MLVPKRVVDTLAVDLHVFHQILDRSSLVTARPEDLHSLIEDFIPIELFLSRHFVFSRLSFILFLERTVKNRPAAAYWEQTSGSVRDEVEFTE